MPRETKRNELDSSLLSEFATGCQLPETIQIVLGYESLESEELSFSAGEIVNLHSLREATWVIARDENGNEFSIPLAYPGKIFESIPQGCREKYETVEELIVAFPKYFRSLRDIPESGVTAGDILQLLESSEDDGGSKQLRCRMVGKSCTIALSSYLSGSFETLGNVNPGCLREVIDGHSLPVRVRVQSGKTIQALDGTNTTPPVKFEGLLFLEQTLQQKVFIVSTLHGKQLRVLKIPIDLEITVKRDESLDPNLFSRICHFIQSVINIDSAITCGNAGDVSWYFEIHTDPVSDNIPVYDEIGPQVPPRSPVKPPCESDLKQNKINSVDTRYGTPTPKQQSLKKPPVPVEPNWREIKPLPPPVPSLVAKTPNAVMPKQLKKELPPSSRQPPKQKAGGELNNTASQSYAELRNPDADPQDYCRLQEVMPKDEGMVQRDSKVTTLKEMVKEGGNYDTPTPKQQSLKRPPVPVKPNWREIKPLPPPVPSLVAKTPNAVMPKQLKKELPPSSRQPPKQKGGGELNNTASKSYAELRNPDADPQDYCRLQEVMPKDEGMVQRDSKVTTLKEMVKEGGNYDTPTPKQQSLKRPPVPVKPNWREIKPLPPPVPSLVAKTPNAVMPKQLKKELPPSSFQAPKQNGGSELNNTASQFNIELRNPDADPQDYSQYQEVMPKDEGMVQRGNKVTPLNEMVEEGGNDVALKESHKESKLCSSENTAQGHQTTCNESPREHLEGISVSEVSEWLRKLGLNQYVDKFADESIDGTMLLELDDETMQYIGIKNPLHRKKLSMFIQRGWIPKR